MERESKFKWLNNIFNSVYSLNTKKNQIDREMNNKYYIQLNLVMSNSVKSKFFWSPFLSLVLFNLIYSSCLKFRCVGYLEVASQSQIFKSIQIMFVMSKL